jgi:uncharacterized membrane-anchored protein YjiN (DUF445 family)
VLHARRAAALSPVGYDLELARQQRETLARAASYGVLACAPRLSFAKLAGWWLERYERKVKTGQRRERTLALHRYHLKRNLLPSLAPKLARAITAQDIADLIERLREDGRSERTIANALHTLNNIMRFAIRSDWITENPLEKLERDERPHPVSCVPRVLGQQEIRRAARRLHARRTDPDRHRPLHRASHLRAARADLERPRSG